MPRSALVVVVLVAGSLPTSRLFADDFSIELRVRAAKDSPGVDATYPVIKPAPRNVLKVDADTPIHVKWTVRNVDKTAVAKDVLVHFFLVKQEKLDQREIPKLGKNVVVESALTMDFRPTDKSDGEFTVTIPGSGFYMVRVELQGTMFKDKPGPFAALDLDAR